MSTLTNHGKLRFMVFQRRFITEVFLEFLRRLLRSVDRKVFLIVDRHPVHKAKKIERWLAERERFMNHVFPLTGRGFMLWPWISNFTRRLRRVVGVCDDRRSSGRC